VDHDPLGVGDTDVDQVMSTRQEACKTVDLVQSATGRVPGSTELAAHTDVASANTNPLSSREIRSTST
jgi:uncharacterized protein YaaQ